MALVHTTCGKLRALFFFHSLLYTFVLHRSPHATPDGSDGVCTFHMMIQKHEAALSPHKSQHLEKYKTPPACEGFFPSPLLVLVVSILCYGTHMCVSQLSYDAKNDCMIFLPGKVK